MVVYAVTYDTIINCFESAFKQKMIAIDLTVIGVMLVINVEL